MEVHGAKRWPLDQNPLLPVEEEGTLSMHTRGEPRRPSSGRRRLEKKLSNVLTFRCREGDSEKRFPFQKSRKRRPWSLRDQNQKQRGTPKHMACSQG